MTYEQMPIDIAASIKEAEQMVEDHDIWRDQNLDMMCSLLSKDHKRGLYYL